MELNVSNVLIVIAVSAFIITYILLRLSKNKIQSLELDNKNIGNEFQEYKAHTVHLKQYEVIDDAKVEAKRIMSLAEDALEKSKSIYKVKVDEAEEVAASELKEARSKAKSISEKAEEKLADAHNIASKIEEDANTKAEEIAGDAWEAKQNAEQYEATVKAMKNIIKGYGDEYLVPNESVLDELAAEYDHKEAGQELAKIRTLIKSMVKNNEAADCDYVETHRKTTAIEFVLDAFNGKVDTIMSKVKHDNYGKLLQQLEDAFRIVNHNGKPFRDARILPRYYDVMVEELKMAVAVKELKRIDVEEQRRIKQEMRDEEKARREYEKAIKEVEKEEKMLKKAMVEAEALLAGAAAEERAKYEEQLSELNQKWMDAEEKGKRALSMAQQTKQGHVYVISNVGSFGENVFKIGLTRRLEPLDRVKELGDASVPFSFDVHAMIHSTDAPKLEKELHEVFKSNQVNKVNSRKEFFNVALTEIKNKVDELGVNGEAHWTMKAEALEYRESIQLAK
ncbi:MAG: DUF4041 domain-containing protein [Methylococcales bacterium]